MLTRLMSDLPDAVWVCAAATDQERQVSTVRLRLSRSTAGPHDDLYTVIVNPLLRIC